MLELRGVTKVYSEHGEEIRAVDGVTLSVRRGEIFSLLGPNGAGKTTTFRMVATLEKPTDGVIYIDGFNCEDNPGEVRDRIGLVPQGESYYEKLTAEEFMRLMGKLYGVQGEVLEDRIGGLLELVDLEGRKDSLIEGFSGGMKQRLSLASGLIHRPSLLLLDEPTTGLDPETRRKLWNLIEELNEEGVTVLINTHIMEEADALSDRVGIMNRGKLVEVGTPKKLKNMVRGGEALRVDVEPAEREAAVQVLKSNGGKLVKDVASFDGKLELVTGDQRKALLKVPQVLSESGIKVLGLEALEPSLEDAFIELTSGG
ncbi:hypothetical protein AKJ37_05545 [candidate division MSBL1 archaeon SCGC-AAA259I09]|uniref:ABC transporter domain-containing protein n=2 Tax=candidate division MSBL1 TaxID=215777 RepID=A0A133UQC3_9EURY|nr:hypothetical protein AKJ62_05050 [candidate division MSBL1 archaeon SCGC-AAA259D14]KXA96327.1 hypothetical protein AKJ37_05545 [candidate division MSBL1 archaeon SCGC-AAA259I09]